MNELYEMFEIEQLLNLIKNIEAMISSLIRMFGNVFSWLGPGVLTAIGIGATIAIILRVVGR